MVLVVLLGAYFAVLCVYVWDQAKLYVTRDVFGGLFYVCSMLLLLRGRSRRCPVGCSCLLSRAALYVCGGGDGDEVCVW